ncbi:nitric oxide reductase NorE protein [Crossiella equi]|uniref:Cytochrome aa3 subunit 3 n=1 Tax=Crossiella equi TaxID=130796 RepID=A0ABS5ARL3_9PSEU|nr:cytochrome c oxidase subunit 3 [Crossiella equi]MBP2479213.1 nitric oxide reductase NorE protein [Crossiella equi]
MTARLDARQDRLAAKGRERRIPGEEGVWVLIFGDLVIFAVVFATFLHYRGEDVETYNRSALDLTQGFGLVNTLVLLTSSLLVVLAVRALPTNGTGASRLFAGALGLGGVFCVVKAVEYTGKLTAGITPGTNGFWMFFYVLTGLHLLHLLVGMGVLGLLVRLARKPLTAKRFAVLEGGACFWHMVDLLWILLFPLLYLVR